MKLIDYLKVLSFLMMFLYVLDTQWTFYKMEPSTINRIYQPLIQKPEIGEAYANTRLSTSLDIDLKNSHLLRNLETFEDTVKSNTMEGFYRNFLSGFLSLTSLSDNKGHSYGERAEHMQIDSQKDEKHDENDEQNANKRSFIGFIFESLMRPFLPNSPKSVSMDLAMIEDRIKFIE